MENNPEEQSNNRPWLYKKGQSGNPGGRPTGSLSMKTYIKNKLLAMTDEEREEYLEGIDKKVLWEMAEGKAESKTEVVATITTTSVDPTDPDILKSMEIIQNRLEKGNEI